MADNKTDLTAGVDALFEGAQTETGNTPDQATDTVSSTAETTTATQDFPENRPEQMFQNHGYQELNQADPEHKKIIDSHKHIGRKGVLDAIAKSDLPEDQKKLLREHIERANASGTPVHLPVLTMKDGTVRDIVYMPNVAEPQKTKTKPATKTLANTPPEPTVYNEPEKEGWWSRNWPWLTAVLGGLLATVAGVLIFRKKDKVVTTMASDDIIPTPPSGGNNLGSGIPGWGSNNNDGNTLASAGTKVPESTNHTDTSVNTNIGHIIGGWKSNQ